MPTLDFENNVVGESGFTFVAGLDEAGRGALAGPVVAAAVILPLDAVDLLEILSEVDDSKRLTAVARQTLYSTITHTALTYGIGICAATVIDEIGIIPSTKQAMLTAVAQLTPQPDYLLIDGRIRLKTTPILQQSIIRGDSHSLSIAAASILAKVTRDQLMIEMDNQYPDYGFARHKGYGTEYHRHQLEALGPTAVHRYSFAPLRKTLL